MDDEQKISDSSGGINSEFSKTAAAFDEDAEFKTEFVSALEYYQDADLMKLSVEELHDYIGALTAEKEALEAEKEKLDLRAKQGGIYLDQLSMLKRDFDNFRQRTRSATEHAKDDGKIFVIEKVIPLLDTFDRAMDSLRGRDDQNVFKMVFRQFEKILKEIGLEEIDVLDKEFDPNLAEAVANEDASKRGLRNIVLEVYTKGYKFKDRVIRYAQVKVGI